MKVFDEIPFTAIRITDGLWHERQKLHYETAIHYQAEQLEKVGTMDNFRIAAKEKQGVRRGYFYVDSDAHKWAEAAAVLYAVKPEKAIRERLDSYISTLEKAQEKDGYLYTFNQLQFPSSRWVNLQVEHELYTIGHLIEAGLADYHANGQTGLLTIAKRAADLVCEVFQGKGPRHTPGHQEIEIALIKLYRHKKEKKYLQLAEQLLMQRGKISLFPQLLISEFFSHIKRSRTIHKLQKSSIGSKLVSFDFTENLQKHEPPFLKLRCMPKFFNGAFNQQNKPLEKLHNPSGHAVRWGYYMTAASLLAHETNNTSLFHSLQTAWDNMVQKHMFISGGVGALPLLEGFGNDYDLDNEFAYCETCAAIASVYWSWEMLQLSGQAKYADLIEWQLYNAVAVGVGLNGTSYLYRNPLESHGGLLRRPWFNTACCPSNVARSWGTLAKYIYTQKDAELWIHQYISNTYNTQTPSQNSVRISMDSAFPWSGKIKVKLEFDKPETFGLHLRLPSWSGPPTLTVNGQKQSIQMPDRPHDPIPNAYSPYLATYISLTQKWEQINELELLFPMVTRWNDAHPKVKSNRGKQALSRGPLLYCVEDIDNPECSFDDLQIRQDSPVEENWQPEKLGAHMQLTTKSTSGAALHFIPYYLWANRDCSKMKTWIPADS